MKANDRRKDSRTARSSSTTRIRTATSFVQSPESPLRGAGANCPARQRAVARPASFPGGKAHGEKLAAIQVNQPEARRLEQTARHLVSPAGNRHTDEFGLGSLPVRAPTPGVRARHPALWHSQNRASLLVGGRRASSLNGAVATNLEPIIVGDLLLTKIGTHRVGAPRGASLT